MNKWIRPLYQPGLPLGKDGRRVTVSPEHIALSKKAAKEGMVLLKNESGVLPLPMGTKVALFGKATIDYVKGGGGSGDVSVPYVHNLYEGFKEVIGEEAIFPDTIRFYEDCVGVQYKDGWLPGMTAEPELPDELLDRAACFTDTAIISISRFSGESWDRKADFDTIKQHKLVDENAVRMSDALFEDGDFYFSKAERRMIETVSRRFEKAIVVLNVGGMIETASLRDNPEIDAVLLALQGGMEGGTAAAELLMGLGNPSGKLSDTFARDLKDYPGSATFFDSDDYVNYYEDIYVGYRYFETIPGAADKVIYPFGYGLSYTQFSLTQPHIRMDGDTAVASVTVCNTGNVPGKEVIQIYYSAPQGVLGKPSRVLIGYHKTQLLEPGDEQQIVIRFSINDMASYDDLGKVQKSAWILERGAYRFFIGTSVRDTVEADQCYELEDTRIVRQLTPKMVPTGLSKRMLSDGSYEELPTAPCNDYNASILPRMAEDDMEFPTPAVRSVPRYQAFEPKEKPQLIEVAEGKRSLNDFIHQLPDEDLAHLLGGQPNTGLANTYGIGNNPIYGIPNIMTEDGPAGVRFAPETGVTTTAFPCATLLACTWDPELVYAVGSAGALEAKENNIQVWLTPAVCIHRSPLCGRNFEYYSEDPLLTGTLAAAMVQGIQSQHIAAAPKHFALNNKESNRKNSDSRASERAIREIYIRQFEIIVKEAKPWVIMSSYNIINGQRASENEDMLKGILRAEWHFDGMVTSDWWTFGEHYKEAAAGNDLKMPVGYPDRLLEALRQGALSREAMELAAKHILTLILRME